jgi:hypothetical protein
MKTKSECLFEKYCKSIRYQCNSIATSNSKTPDYCVRCGDDKIIAEIKELSPSPDDKRRARELRENRWTSGKEQHGKRINNEIKDSAKQLKVFASRNLPCALVLYDNTVVNGIRTRAVSQLLEPSLIDFGMYGLQMVILSKPSINKAGIDTHNIANVRGGERQMTVDSRVYISAVSVLCEDQNGGEPYLYSFHNWFAKIPLPLHLFRGPNDRHFVKPDHPDKCPQKWVENEINSS